ncbi:MAG: ABC transporter permease [Spirochaetes bacterium]|nr:ABC transporter permease [Spirochaetota bacterium]
MNKEIIYKTVKLAWRNVRRNKRRTFLTLFTMFVGFFAITVLDGFVTYSMNQLGETIVKSGVGHIQIALNENYYKEGETDPSPFIIPQTDETVKMILKLPEVKDVIKCVKFQGLISFNGKNENTLSQSVDAESSEETLSRLNFYQGRGFNGESGIIIGKILAEKLGVKEGDSVTLYGPSAQGGVNVLDLEVSAIAGSGITDLDGVASYITTETAESLMISSDLTLLTVYLENVNDIDAVITKINQITSGKFSIKKWSEVSEYYRLASTSYSTVFGVATIIIFIVSLFAVANTITMSVYERIREMGTIRAFGMNRRYIFLMFTLEGIILGFIGTLIGCLGGFAVSYIINFFGGIEIGAQPGYSESMILLFTPKISIIFINVILGIIISATASLIPSAKAARIQVREALSYK